MQGKPESSRIACSGLTRIDWTLDVSGIHLWKDLITPPHLGLPVEKGIPGAEGVTLEEAYHVVTGKALKKRFCNILFDFLSDH